MTLLWLGLVLWSWWFTDLRLESLLGALGGLGLFLAPLWLLDKLPRLAAGLEETLRRAVRGILASRVTLVVLVALLAGAVAAGFSAGALQMESSLGDEVRVELRQPGGEPATLTLPAGERVRRPVWTGFSGNAEVAVEVPCFSPAHVTLRPWRRASLQVPGELDRVAVLLHPSATLSDLAASADMELAVTLPGEAQPRRTGFDGHPVWIGLPAGCPVPEELTARWRQRFADRPGLLQRLTRTRALDGEPPRLAAEQQLRVTVLVHGRPLVERTITLAADDTLLEELDVQP